MKKMKGADLFCGAGGTSTGAEQSGAVGVVFALNHWDIAVQTHSRNHPGAKHVNSRIEMVKPSECPRIDLLMASPECTHHSRARGGRPTSDQQRAGARHVMDWVEFHRPSYVVVENVVEFKQWGPVGDDGRPLESLKGRFFDAWLMDLRAAGYKVEYQELNAADYGAATSRNRLFVIARKGNRNPLWPEPTHVRTAWRSAADVINWNIPCPSIFSRRKPLADKTLSRFDAGLKKFVGPFVAKFRGGEDAENVDRPVSTITAGGGHHGLVLPFAMNWDHHGSQGDCVREIGKPFATMTTKANSGLVMPFMLATGSGGAPRHVGKPTPTIVARDGTSLVLPFLVDVNHGDSGGSRTYSSKNPVGTIATHNGLGIAIPWLSSYYGVDTQTSAGNPLPVIPTKDRHALCMAICRGPQDWPQPTSAAMQSLQATMRELGVADLLFRMFTNPELAAAQGFPSDYYFAGTKADVTRQIGNSVSPPVAKAICTAIAG